MPPVDESHDAASKTKTVRFDVTPIMSTYLLAFVVGEFDFVESKTSRVSLDRTIGPIAI